MTLRTIIAFLCSTACIFLVGVRWANSRSQPRHTLGISNGRLADCRDYPNCVSTQASDEQHRMDPIPYEQSAEKSQALLETTIESMPRSRIVSSGNGYVHVEFTSLLFGFVDDVELMIDQPSRLIHFRSASRTGKSDLGVNRKRMENLRQRLPWP